MHSFLFSDLCTCARLAAPASVLISLNVSVALAHTEPTSATQMDRLVVVDRATDLVGSASSASEGNVGYVDLSARPFLRRGELLEAVPGVVITQHSGGGKANQYFLRGFNLDHGTDFAVSVEGMPVNMRTHAHGQGYSDLNFIVPEFVEAVNYTKGPYAARVGDFSAAGAAQFSLFTRLPANFSTLELGENNYARFVAGGSWRHAGESVTTAGFEATHDDGPWLLEENLERYNALLRHGGRKDDHSEWTLTGLFYSAEWTATDQIPSRAIDAGALHRFGYVDPSNGGKSERASLSFDWTHRGAEAVTRVNAYAVHYRLDLYSNFTYFLEDPVRGDQFNQRDRRGVYGLNVDRRTSLTLWGKEMEVETGLQARGDVIDELQLNRTERRERVASVRDDAVRELSAGVYGRVQTRWMERFRSEVGLRLDGYHFDVESGLRVNSGTRKASIGSPKLALIYGPWDKTEVYLSGGYGFHSNDARGTTIRVDPVDPATPAARVSPLVRSRGFEAGLRTTRVPGLVSTIAAWYLELDSELVFVGDAGGTEESGATRRYGLELANFYRATSWLSFDADASFTRGRYVDAAPADRIANSISTVLTAGAVVGRAEGWFGSVRLRYFGEQPLTEDNTVRQPSSNTVNLRLGWRSRDWEISATILNVLDRGNDDIAYAYASRLPGEPLEGVEDKHIHPAEPRTVRFAVSRRF